MSSLKIISSDSHVIEPPDLWSSVVGGKFEERTPHVVADDEGDWWYIDGHRTESYGEPTQAGQRFEHLDKVTTAGRFADVRPGAYIPDEFVKDMDIDGVYGAVIYPTVGLTAYAVSGSDLFSSICTTYNDWLSEFCQTHPDRLKGVAMINLDDVEEGVAELKRTNKKGLAGAMIPVFPSKGKPYRSAEYDPLFDIAQDMGVPLSLHVQTNRAGPSEIGFNLDDIHPTDYTTADYWVRVSLSDMIFSGVFERFPRLMVGSVEHELGWAPHFIHLLDYAYTERNPQYTESTRKAGWTRFKDNMLPSDFFRRNVFLSFQADGLGIRERAKIGVDGLMWGSDYPHLESTFPRSRQFLNDILEGVPEDDKEKIVGGNADRLYHFN